MIYQYSHRLGVFAPSLDPDAKAYIDAVVAAGATVSGAQKKAISDFVKTGKADGWYTSIKRLYLPIWAAASPNAIDMIGGTSGTFEGNVTYSAGYVEGDGSTGYFDTTIAPNAVSGISTASAYTFGLVLDTLAATEYVGRSRNSLSQDWNLGCLSSTNLSSGIMANSSGAGLLLTSVTIDGIISGSRVGGTRFNARRDSTGRTNLGSLTDSDFGSVPTYNYYFMGGNNAGTATYLSTVRFGSFGFGTGLTDSQDSAFTLALKTMWETCTSLTIP